MVDVADLIRRTAAGDRRAFAELYGVTSPKLFAIALRIVRTADAAEDVLQGAFLLIWRKAAHFDSTRGDAFAWMATIVRTCAIDTVRASTRSAGSAAAGGESLSESAMPASSVDADGLWQQVRVRGRLGRCFDALSEEQRRCILLAYFRGMSYDQVAAATGYPPGSVRSWVRRGLLKLKDCLGE